jgi:ABC-type dipeptide/oligopeptide/nickel transport system permease component
MVLFVFGAAVMITVATLGEAVVALLDPRVRLE